MKLLTFIGALPLLIFNYGCFSSREAKISNGLSAQIEIVERESFKAPFNTTIILNRGIIPNEKCSLYNGAVDVINEGDFDLFIKVLPYNSNIGQGIASSGWIAIYNDHIEIRILANRNGCKYPISANGIYKNIKYDEKTKCLTSR